MGMFNDFMKLFKGNAQQPQQQPPQQQPSEPSQQPVQPQANDTPIFNSYMQRWEQERQARIKETEARLKDWIIISVQEKGGLEFSWESGNDEVFITFKDTNEEEKDNYYDLEDYVIDQLDIPDAGEFQMNGSGTIYIADNLVRAKYSSVMKGLIDYNEETEEEIYGEEEEDSGDKMLFAI
jgi:hypothetical protein